MMSQSTLAGMVGSTRSRINYFMNKFARLGFIETDGGLTVNRSLLRVIPGDHSCPLTSSPLTVTRS